MYPVLKVRIGIEKSMIFGFRIVLVYGRGLAATPGFDVLDQEFERYVERVQGDTEVGTALGLGKPGFGAFTKGCFEKEDK